jgi:sigma-B regulation protein RsbU (phosphoserine phosphatase)
LNDKKPRLLIIDDDAPFRDSLSEWLSGSGYIVHQASTARDALDKLSDASPDVVLLDLHMPDISGFDFLTQLKQRNEDIPVIVITGAGTLNDAIQALRLGASDFLSKPIVDMTMLDHAVHRCVEQSRLRLENRLYREKIEEANRKLSQSLHALEQDQQAGRLVQLKMLPPSPKHIGTYRFTHHVVPSLYLSGDFLDYFTAGDNDLVFFIADVSGHGASSAFITVLLKNLFARKRSDFLHRGDESVLNPSVMLDLANQELLATETGKHATLCVCRIDMVNNQLLYAVAGHLPLPVLHTIDSCQYLECKNLPVGMVEGAEYQTITKELPEVFTLWLFSDGILEVMPAEGVRGQEALLLQLLRDLPPSVAEIAKRLGFHENRELPDDVAILMLEKR